MAYARVLARTSTVKRRAMRVSGIVESGMAGVAWATPTVQYMKASGVMANDVDKACYGFVSHTCMLFLWLLIGHQGLKVKEALFV